MCSPGIPAVSLTFIFVTEWSEDPAGLPHDSHFRALNCAHVPPLEHCLVHLLYVLYLRDVHCSRHARVGPEIQEVCDGLQNLLVVQQLIVTLLSEIRGTWDPAVPKVNRRSSVTR